MVIKVFRTTLELEWWRHRQATSEQGLHQARQDWASSKERKILRKPVDNKDMIALRGAKRAWNAGDLQKDQLPGDPSLSKKARREEKNSFYVGGMRNPHRALRRLTILQEAGNDLARLWANFIKDVPWALEAARTYGTERCSLDEDALKEWSLRLAQIMKADPEPEVELRSKFQFKSPLKAEMWRAWQKFSKDPEKHIADWAKHGAPLGMASEIRRSNGVFPPCG